MDFNISLHRCYFVFHMTFPFRTLAIKTPQNFMFIGALNKCFLYLLHRSSTHLFMLAKYWMHCFPLSLFLVLHPILWVSNFTNLLSSRPRYFTYPFLMLGMSVIFLSISSKISSLLSCSVHSFFSILFRDTFLLLPVSSSSLLEIV